MVADWDIVRIGEITPANLNEGKMLAAGLSDKSAKSTRTWLMLAMPPRY